MNIIS